MSDSERRRRINHHLDVVALEHVAVADVRAAGKKMGLCAEPAAKEVCALSCGECEAAQ